MRGVELPQHALPALLLGGTKGKVGMGEILLEQPNLLRFALEIKQGAQNGSLDE